MTTLGLELGLAVLTLTVAARGGGYRRYRGHEMRVTATVGPAAGQGRDRRLRVGMAGATGKGLPLPEIVEWRAGTALDCAGTASRLQPTTGPSLKRLTPGPHLPLPSRCSLVPLLPCSSLFNSPVASFISPTRPTPQLLHTTTLVPIHPPVPSRPAAQPLHVKPIHPSTHPTQPYSGKPGPSTRLTRSSLAS
jgi:hypothetical protein